MLHLEKAAMKTPRKINKYLKKQKLELKQHGVSHIYIWTCIQHLDRSTVWQQELAEQEIMCTSEYFLTWSSPSTKFGCKTRSVVHKHFTLFSPKLTVMTIISTKTNTYTHTHTHTHTPTTEEQFYQTILYAPRDYNRWPMPRERLCKRGSETSPFNFQLPDTKAWIRLGSKVIQRWFKGASKDSIEAPLKKAFGNAQAHLWFRCGSPCTRGNHGGGEPGGWWVVKTLQKGPFCK